MPKNKVVKMSRSRGMKAEKPPELEKPRESPETVNIGDFEHSFNLFVAALQLLDQYPPDNGSETLAGRPVIEEQVFWLAEVAGKLQDEFVGVLAWVEEQRAEATPVSKEVSR